MRPRILLVDDELPILKVVGKRLEIEGFAVSVAMDGQEAVRKAQLERPDLILLDLMLPKMNGFEVCTLLKDDHATQRIPIVILSAKTQEEDERRALACGADAYFKKPFNAPALMEGIRKLLGPREASGQSDRGGLQ
jgi:DNA-binding response OmpR family regulator